MAEIEYAIRRTRRYWFEDGILEIAAGTLALVVGLLELVRTIAPPSGPMVGLSTAGQIVALVGGTWLVQRTVVAAKRRFVYPRTGFVAYRRAKGPRRLLSGAVAGVSGALFVAIARELPPSIAWVPLTEALVIGAGLLLLGRSIDIARFDLLALVSVAAGAAAAFTAHDDVLGSAGYFGAMGVSLLASGSLGLRSYLGRSQPAVESPW